MDRIETDQALVELEQELIQILACSSSKILVCAEAKEEFLKRNGDDTHIPRAHWDSETETLFAFIVKDETALGAIKLKPLVPPDEHDLKFIQGYVRVYVSDLIYAANTLKDSELWKSLQQNRFTRAIARASAFHTDDYLDVLAATESASALKYEGASFSTCIFLTKQEKWMSKNEGSSFVRFRENLDFHSTILNEKWIRSLADGSKVGLVALGHNKGLIGVVTIPYQPDNIVGAPHGSLAGAVSLIKEGVNAFMCTPNGDLYVIQRAGYAFARSQGKWQHLNYNSLQSIILEYLSEKIATPLMRLCLDLSYTRTGALFCILDSDAKIEAIVPDHDKDDIPNQALRQASRKLSIKESAHRKIIRAIAGVDGATVLNVEGQIADSACMITEPDSKALKKVGLHDLQRFSGARTTAAWNASIYGISIKISEDGPIEVYHHGKLVGKLA